MEGVVMPEIFTDEDVEAVCRLVLCEEHGRMAGCCLTKDTFFVKDSVIGEMAFIDDILNFSLREHEGGVMALLCLWVVPWTSDEDGGSCACGAGDVVDGGMGGVHAMGMEDKVFRRIATEEELTDNEHINIL